MNTPAILRRRVVRFGIGLAVIGALAFVFARYVTGGRDEGWDPGHFNSAGYIAATISTEDGEQAVMLDPNGKLVRSPGYSVGATDQPAAWSPDGERIYFASDREEMQSHIFRWNPATNLVERRTIDKRTKSGIVFDADPDNAKPTALVMSGGAVLVVEPQSGKSRQIMPPPGSGRNEPIEGDEASLQTGATAAFEQMYSGIGTSVKYARFSKDREFLIAAMRREDGEILVAQRTFKVDNPVDATDRRRLDLTKPPIIIVGGERIEFDVSQSTGDVVYACQAFQFPDPKFIPPNMKVGGKVKYPFRHALGIYRPGDPGIYEPGPTAASFITVWNDNKICFAMPRISPDGIEVACQVGPYEGAGVLQANNLVLMPARVRGGAEGFTLVPTRVYDMSWHPDGQSVLFVGEQEGKRAIFRVNRDRTGLTNLTKDLGDFRGPVWSPITK